MLGQASVLFLIATLLATLQSSGLQLTVAPRPENLPDATHTVIVIFELDIDAEGRVERTRVVRGEPPFIERTRLAVSKWVFEGTGGRPAVVSAVFVFKPQPDVHNGSRAVTVDPPRPEQPLRTAFPTKMVVPGYPAAAIGSGMVVIQVWTAPDGGVERATVVNPSFPDFDEAALQAVNEWQFSTNAASPASVVVFSFRAPRWRD